MLIIDDKDDLKLKEISSLILCLKVNEIEELIGSLQDTLKEVENGKSDFHSHINSDDYEKEITVCAYGTEELNRALSPLIRKLIKSEGRK